MAPRSETLTTEQVARRRTIERTSQRNSRARTKARIKELERMLESVQSAGEDERFGNTVSLLMQQQEHGRRLQDLLRDVHKLLNESKKLWQTIEEDAIPKAQGSESPEPLDGHRKDDASPRPTCDLVDMPKSNLGQCVLDSSGGIAAYPKSVPVWRTVDMALERAVEHLSQQEPPLQRRDTDIAIRAVADGWTNVKTIHSLDVGWLTLKELDQTLFCDCSPPTRLVILRAMRLNMLKHASSERLDFVVPPFYCHTPAQKMVKHPLLVDFFPWPNLRDFLILEPSIYQSEVFPSYFSRNVHFMWPLSTSDAWTTDCSTSWYNFSPLFESQLMDINRWALSSEFFAHYPQLIGYVPMHDPLPRNLSPQPAPRECEEEVGSSDQRQGIMIGIPELYDFGQVEMSFALPGIAMSV